MSFCLDFLIIHMVNDPKCKVYVLKFYVYKWYQSQHIMCLIRIDMLYSFYLVSWNQILNFLMNVNSVFSCFVL